MVVEFALVLPLAVMMLLGAIDLGRMVACRMMLTYAVGEGVQRAAAKSVNLVADVQGVVMGAAPMFQLTGSVIDVMVDGAVANSATFAARPIGSTVSVSATGSFQSLFRSTWSKTWTETSAAMRVQ